MNKLFAKIIAIALALTVIFSFTACSEVENGSKIERIQITLDVDGVEYKVEAKLYVDFAPKTIAHIKNLIKNGYYNGLDVSNATSSYFQFGDYKLENNQLVAVDGEVSPIAGEFEKRGFVGNKLTVSQGAIILKRATEAETGSKYDTGKATIAIALSYAAPFNAKEYCVFGKVVSDDGDADADSSSVEYLSSLERLMKVKECIEDENGRKVYYCLNDDTVVEDAEEDEFAKNWEGCYITYAEYEDKFTYFHGNLSASELSKDNMLSEEEITDLTAKLSTSENFMHIPTVKVVIKSIVLL